MHFGWWIWLSTLCNPSSIEHSKREWIDNSHQALIPTVLASCEWTPIQSGSSQWWQPTMSPMPLTPDCTAPPSLLMTTQVPTPTPAPNPFAILQFQPSTSQKVPPQNCDSSANCTAKNGYPNCSEIQTREILDVVQESYCSFTSGPVVGSNGTSNGGETACNNELCCPEHTKNVVYNSPSNVFTMV